MTSIKFLTWNVRGLGDKIKRSAALSYLKKQHEDVTVLVEMHVEGRLQLALRRPWVGWAYHSTHTSHAWGVSVLVAKSVHFELCDVSSDSQGRYVFLSVKFYGEPFLLLACYIPPPFFTEVITEGFAYMSRYPSVPAVWETLIMLWPQPWQNQCGGTTPSEHTSNQILQIIVNF